MPRKHLIAASINKKQQQQSKISLKCIREIKAAVKVGGPNPDANPRLKVAIARGLQNNLSRDTIMRNINSNKDSESLKELYYEGYGPKGLAIIIKALTDNEQRTISNLRGYFSKLKGEISKPNSVMVLFNEYGQIILDKANLDYDKILQLTLNYEIVDLIEDESAFELLTDKKDFLAVKEIFDSNSEYNILDASIKYISSSLVDITEDDDKLLTRFIDSCEDDDDIQWVVTNVGNII